MLSKVRPKRGKFTDDFMYDREELGLESSEIL